MPTLGTLLNLHTTRPRRSATAPTADRFAHLLSDKALARRGSSAGAARFAARPRARAPGARIHLVSGYRSEKRNEMMRKKGRHVASHSQHSLGQAVDFRVEGLTVVTSSKK